MESNYLKKSTGLRLKEYVLNYSHKFQSHTKESRQYSIMCIGNSNDYAFSTLVLLGYTFVNTHPAIIANKKEGASTSNFSK